MEQIKIAKGNHKLGKSIYNSSLIPVQDCINCEFCRHKCYAKRSWIQYPKVRRAWGHNSKLAHSDLLGWSASHMEFIGDHKVERFRWMVAGDLLSEEMYLHIGAIAKEFPDTRFLLFTKAFDYIRDAHNEMPTNFKTMMSIWDGMVVDYSIKLPIARTVSAKVFDKIPNDTIEIHKCAGSCEDCSFCFDYVGDVVFKLH